MNPQELTREQRIEAAAIILRDAVEEADRHRTSSCLDNLPDILTPRMLAEALRVSTKTLERWRASNIGPSYCRLPASKAVRYMRADVIDFINATRHDTR